MYEMTHWRLKRKKKLTNAKSTQQILSSWTAAPSALLFPTEAKTCDDFDESSRMQTCMGGSLTLATCRHWGRCKETTNQMGNSLYFVNKKSVKKKVLTAGP